MAAKMIVLQGVCCSRGRMVTAAVTASLQRLKISNLRVYEVDFFSYSYWDGPDTVFISPAPILAKVQGCVEALPMAYSGKLEDAELDKTVERCLKKINSDPNQA